MNTVTTNLRPHEPQFDFRVPAGYSWFAKQKLVGYNVNSQLQPWYYLDANAVFNVTQKWPDKVFIKGELIAFARRQDCDDIACFLVSGRTVDKIVVVHGWTSEGYNVVASYDQFWNWIKSVIDDIAEWVQNYTD